MGRGSFGVSACLVVASFTLAAPWSGVASQELATRVEGIHVP